MIKRALSRTIKLTLFWSLLSIGLPLQAEDLKVVITGKVVRQSNEPLPYANVFVIQNNEVAENTVTDDLGKFELTAKSGKYALGVSYIGYKMVIQEIDTTSGSHLDLGTIVLEEDTEVLQTVVVMGEAVRVKTLPNGFSVNVDRLRETSNDAFDLLRRLPQIQVKGTELNVVGKQNVVVQIGNVVQRVPASELSSVLKGFDAGLIDQVEVLMQPPLRYDPDGNTAMIILHTSSVFKEYMGGVIGTEIMEGERKNDRYGGYASLIYNRKKLYWSVAPAYNYNTSTMREDVKYIFPDRSYQLLTPSEGSSAYAGINATLQYQYNNRGHLGLTTSVNNRKVESFFESSERHTPKQYERFDANTLNDYNSKKPKVDATAYIEQEFGSNNKVWLELSYFNYTDRSHNKFSSKYSSDTQEYLKYEDNDHITVSGWGANNDYSLSLDSDGKYKIDTGLKALFTSTSNNRNHSQWMYENSDETFEQKGQMSLNEIWVTPYVSGTMNFSSRWWLRMGLKAAITLQDLTGTDDDFKRTHTTILPSMHLAFTPHSSHKIYLTFNTSAIQPSFSQINPFEWRTSQMTYRKGNTKLKPEVNYKYNLGYTYKGAFTISSTLRQRKGIITAVSITDQLGNIYTQTSNAQDNIFFGLEADYYWDKLRWITVSLNTHFGKSKYTSSNPQLLDTKSGHEWGLDGYAEFIFNKKRTVTGYISGSYTGKIETAISTINPQYGIDLGVSCFLLQRRLAISLSGMELLASKYKGYSNRKNYRMEFNNRYSYPTLYFSVSYKFSNGKSRSLRRSLSTRDIERRL